MPKRLIWLFILTLSRAWLQAQPALQPPQQSSVLRFGSEQVAFTTLAPPVNTFTMEAWVYLEGNAPNATVLGAKLISNDASITLSYGLRMAPTGRRVEFAQWTGSAYVTATPATDLPMFTWTHVAATQSGGTIQLYVNGVLAASAASPGNLNNSAPFSVGAASRNDGGSPRCGFFGALRQVRLWTRALGASELTSNASIALTGSESGLAAYWPLDDGVGVTARDLGPSHSALSFGNTVPAWTAPSTLQSLFFYQKILFASPLNSPDGRLIDFSGDGRPDLVLTQFNSDTSQPMVAFLNDGQGNFSDATAAVFGGSPPTTIHPRHYAVGDFDKDGHLDFFIADHGVDSFPFNGGQSRILMGAANGTLTDQTASRIPAVQAFTHHVAAGDVNGDSWPDLYLVNLYNSTAVGPRFYMNDGTGHFTADTTRVPASVSNRTLQYESGILLDVNKDGSLDLVLGAEELSNQLTDAVLLNDGTGHFSFAPSNAMPPRFGGPNWGTVNLTSADFDGDGWPDLLMVLQNNYLEARLQLLLNNRDGTYRDATYLLPQNFGQTSDGSQAWLKWAFVADVNNDGLPDIVAVSATNYAHRIFINTGGAQFVESSQLLPPMSVSSPGSLLVGDLDGDQKPELVWLPGTGASLVVGHNVGSLTPGTPVTCTYALVPSATNFPTSGGAGTIAITAPAGCAWTVNDSDAWITTSGTGIGSGSVSFTVASNAGLARGSTISIGTQNVVLSQATGILTPAPQDYVLRFGELASANGVTVGATFTMEGWVSLNSASPGSILMGKAISGDPYAHYAIGLDTTGLKPTFVQSTGVPGTFRQITSPSNIPLHTWTHVAAVLSGGQMYLYVNGVQVASGASPGTPSGASVPFCVGGALAGTQSGFLVLGAMRQVRIWSVALSASDLALYSQETLTGTESGLLFDWPLDDGTGTTARDVGPSHTPLTFLNLTGGQPVWTHTALFDTGNYWDYTTFSIQDVGGGIGDVVNMGAYGLTALLAYQQSLTVPGPAKAFRWVNGAMTEVTNTVLPISNIMVNSPRDMAVADFNGDGLPDVFLATHGVDQSPFLGGQSHIFIQTANGQLLDDTQNRLPIINAFTHSTAAADVNSDGSQDLYLANLGLPGPQLYINDGTGHFTATSAGLPASLANLQQIYSAVRFTDVNNDGYPDLILGSNGGNWDNAVLLNDGHGNFTPAAGALPVKYGGVAGGWAVVAITVADFNGDGYPDLLMVMNQAYLGPTYLQLFLNNRDGTFRDASSNIPQSWNTPNAWIEWARAIDINGDGWPDIVTTYGGYSPHLFINNGDGTFTDRTDTMPSLADAEIMVGDFDGDGKGDLFFSFFGGNYGFARNRNPIPPVSASPPPSFRPSPAISSISVTSAFAGSPGFTLTVNGTGFLAGVSVGRVNGSPRATTVASSTQLSFGVTNADLTSGLKLAITVWNPQPGGGVSPPAYINITPCSFQLSTTSVTLPGAASSGSVTVTGLTGCLWTAASNASFVNVTAGTPGNGDGTVNYSVAANNGAGRTGTMTVAGQTVTLNQFASAGQFQTGSGSISPGGVTRVPLALVVPSGAVLNSFSFTVTVAPATGATLRFEADSSQPAPSVSAASAGSITLTYASLGTAFPGMLTLGNLVVTAPVTATVGQSYTVHIGSIAGASVAIGSGADGTLSVALPVGSFTGQSKLALTEFYYYYDAPSGAYMKYLDGTDAITDHPPDALYNSYSYFNQSWFSREFTDMTTAGIDVVLPYYGGDAPETPQTLGSLPTMVAAAQALVSAGTPGPKIGVMLSTYSLQAQNGGAPIDLTTTAGKATLYGMLKAYFALIPQNLWAMIDGRPIIVMDVGYPIAAFDSTSFDYVRQQFQADFGLTPYIITERTWSTVGSATADAGYGAGADLTGPTAVGDVMTVSPGRNNAAEAGYGAEVIVRPRDCGIFYENAWDAAITRNARLVFVESWNELHEGSDIENTKEYGTQYITLTGQKTQRWKQTPYAAFTPPLVWANLGKDGYLFGLLPSDNVPTQGDGTFLQTRISGRDAAYVDLSTDPPSNNIYFDVDDGFQHATAGPVWVTVEYLDSGTSLLGLDYDSVSGGPYKTMSFSLQNTGQWKRHTFAVPDAFFGGGENGFSDLRLDDYGTLHYYGRVWVSKTAPANDAPQLSVLQDVIIAPGATMDIPLTATAAVGRSLALTLGRGPGFATVQGSVLHLAPTASDVRTCPYPVTALATDNSTPALADSASLRVTVVTPPAITTLSDTSVLAGTAGFTITVNGNNFASNAQVQWNGSPRATTFVSASQLTAAITTADLAAPGTDSITVNNPGGATSSGVTFTVAATCSYQLSATSASAVSGLSSATVSVTAPRGCAWTSASNASFLQVTSGASGSGNGSVGYSVALNTGVARAGTLTIAAQAFTVNQASGINELDVASGAGSPGATVQVPVTLSLASGVSMNSLAFTVTVSPAAGAPLTFVNNASQPAPVASGATASAITLTYTNVATPFAGTVLLGSLQVSVPSAAQLGQTYTVHLSAVTATPSVAAGADAQVSVATMYLVGDVVPSTGDSAGNFGDGQINTLDLLAVLRAVAGIQVPAACSDRFDAMDVAPADNGSTRGGDGVLNTLDLLAVLRKVSGVDKTMPVRTHKTCPTVAPAVKK